MNEMSVEKWWTEICGRGKRDQSREKPIQTPFCPPRNTHEVTETRTRDSSAAVGGLLHGASYNIYMKSLSDI